MIDAYLSQGPKMVKFLEEHTDVKYTAIEHYPDYFQDAPGVKQGYRSLEPLPVSAETLGDDVDNLHPSGPQTIVFGRYGVDFNESHSISLQSPGWLLLLSIANNAAFAFNVSKIVSKRRISTPPSTKPLICSV